MSQYEDLLDRIHCANNEIEKLDKLTDEVLERMPSEGRNKTITNIDVQRKKLLASVKAVSDKLAKL